MEKYISSSDVGKVAPAIYFPKNDKHRGIAGPSIFGLMPLKSVVIQSRINPVGNILVLNPGKPFASMYLCSL